MSVEAIPVMGRASEQRGLAVASPWIWIPLNAALWTVINAVANASTAINHDMVEAYVWGQNFQLGYYKHPPFWAWIAGLWFSVFPASGVSFAALSAVNAAIGLAGAWYLTGCFVRGDKRLAATLLLLASPLYTFFAYKYNANTIFLSLWPWTAYFFVRSLTGRSLAHAVAFGALAGCMILSKYLAFVPLAACLVAAATHPTASRYFRSLAPYAAIATCLAVIAPHIVWLATTGWMPFRYFDSETGQSADFLLRQTANLIPQYLGAQIVIAVLVLLSAGQARRRLFGDPQRRLIAILALGPFVLIVVASLAFRVLLTSNTAIAMFCLTPLLLIEWWGEADVSRLLRRTWLVVSAVTILSLAAAPALAYAHARGWMRGSPSMQEPAEEAATAATALWHDVTGRSLHIVAGTPLYADAIAFYGSDHPSEFIDFDEAKSPWISRTALAQKGLLIACAAEDAHCLKRAQSYVTAAATRRTAILRHDAFGRQGTPAKVILFVIPGRGDAI